MAVFMQAMHVEDSRALIRYLFRHTLSEDADVGVEIARLLPVGGGWCIDHIDARNTLTLGWWRAMHVKHELQVISNWRNLSKYRNVARHGERQSACPPAAAAAAAARPPPSRHRLPGPARARPPTPFLR